MNTSENTKTIIQKIIVMATGSPGSESLVNELAALVEDHGDWHAVAKLVDAHVNTLAVIQPNGVAGMVQSLAQKGLGADISLAEAQDLVQQLADQGVDSWSGLFEWLHHNLEGELAATWNNRAAGAETFVQLLDELGKSDDYDGAQALQAAQNWIQRINADEESLQIATATVGRLIQRFFEGKVQGTVIDGYITGATVFIDANQNGIHDDDEPITTTDSRGNYFFSEYLLPPGPRIAVGGVDMGTGLPLAFKMTAPSGSPVISPISTAYQHVITHPGVLDEQDALLKRMISESNENLLLYDAIQDLVEGQNQAQKQFALNVLAENISLGMFFSSLEIQFADIIETNRTVFDRAMQSGLYDFTKEDLSLSDTVLRFESHLLKLFGDVDPEFSDQITSAINVTLATTLVNSQIMDQSLTSYSNGRITEPIDTASDMFKIQRQNQLDQMEQARLLRSTRDPEGSQSLTPEQLEKLRQVLELADAQRAAKQAQEAAREAKLKEFSEQQKAEFMARAAEAEARQRDAQEQATERYFKQLEQTAAGYINDKTPTSSGGITKPPAITFPEPEPDTVAPDPVALALAEDSGSDKTDRLTNDGRIKVTNVESNARIQYQVQSGWDATADAAESAWTTADSRELNVVNTDGKYTIFVRQVDLAGNVSDEQSLEFELDKTVLAPEVELYRWPFSSNNSSFTSDGRVRIVKREPGADIEYQFAASKEALGESWIKLDIDMIPPPADEGIHSLFVRQIDVAGNVSDSTQLTYTLDKTAPDALSLSLSADGAAIQLANLSPDDSWQYRLDETGSVDETTWLDGEGSSFEITSVEGASVIEFRAYDKADNKSQVSTFYFVENGEEATYKEYAGTTFNDVFDLTRFDFYDDAVFLSVDGNDGDDTVLLKFADEHNSLDFESFMDQFSNIEAIDLSRYQSELPELLIYARHIEAVTDERNTLALIFRDEADAGSIKQLLENVGDGALEETKPGGTDVVTLIGSVAGQTQWTLYGALLT